MWDNGHMNSNGVFSNERHCTNCQKYDLCYPANNNPGIDYERLLNDMPELFTLRSSWDSNRFMSHMKGIAAQLCEIYLQRNVQRTMPAASNEDVLSLLGLFNRGKEENEWDA